MATQSQWNSQVAFLFAMIGSAVGLGNIWRYSYVVYSNGGGTFFIPYLIAILVMGIPFLILEYGLGYKYRNSFSNLLKAINPKFEYVSWLLVIFVFIVVIYYMVILSWDFLYLGSSFTFLWGNDSISFFTQYIGGGSDFSNMTSFILPTTLGVLLMWFWLWYISHKDLNDGIGKASKILLPLLFILMAFIIVYALTLPGAMVGINELLCPDWSMLLNIYVWLAAFSQIIFSLSMGEAISYTYASYLPEGAKLINNVLMVVIANCTFEVCTAFGIFSILGYMSVTSGIPMSELITEGTGLIFVVFPMIFNVMGTIGHIIAPLLFIAILFAGITSAVGLFEPLANSTLHKMKWSRKKTVTVLSIIGCAFSLLFTTGISSYLVGIVDGFVNEFAILFILILQCVIFGWYFDLNSLEPVLNNKSKFNVGKGWKTIIRYILPIFISIMWIIGVYRLFLDATQFELIIYGIITAIVIIASHIFVKINENAE